LSFSSRACSWSWQPSARDARPDPAWVREKKPQDSGEKTRLAPSRSLPVNSSQRSCSGTPACSCRTCVLSRWQAAAPAGNIRTGLRMPSSSSATSDEDEAEGIRERSVSAPLFRGFQIVSTRDQFVPTGGVGPSLIVEARHLPADGGVEQTLLLDSNLKLSVVERKPCEDALPETVLTVSKRPSRLEAPPGLASQSFEIIYSRRSNECYGGPRERTPSLDDLADERAQASRPVERGDPAAVRSALEQAARLYGTSAPELVAAVRNVVPAEVGAPLAVLCC